MRAFYSTIEASQVVNLTSPRCPPEISLRWNGRRDWHDEAYEPLRDLIEATYVTTFDAVCGHYELLEADIIKNGIRNPIVLSAGALRYRKVEELHPSVRDREDLLVSERQGGSRLYVAQKLGLAVPAIINDVRGLWSAGRELISLGDVKKCFRDQPSRLDFSPEQGVLVSGMPYTHIRSNYVRRDQIRLRRLAIREVSRKVNAWLAEHDR